MNFVTPHIVETDKVVGGYIEVDGERYYRIANSHLMPEFFMSLVSSNDHWMFVSSHGGLSAGRRNPDMPLFPYYSADKISDMAHCTGPRTIIRIGDANNFDLWEPFANSGRRDPSIIRNLYKSMLGNRLCFEEVNREQELVFRYCWEFSDQYGFVRNCEIANLGARDISIEVLDGIENVMPCGIDRNFQMRYSNLGDAYKKNELLTDSQLGLLYLSSIPTDCAEPSEGLRATVVWHYGLEDSKVLLSSIQIPGFERGESVTSEFDIRARRGAYLVNNRFQLSGGWSKSWTMVANTGCDQTDVANLNHQLNELPDIASIVRADIAQNEENLKRIISSADGMQRGNDFLRTDRHMSNVLFNVMRGGYPANAYQIKKQEFVKHVEKVNQQAFENNREALESLPNELSIGDLIKRLSETKNSEVLRIGLEYLPFSFSRRHGDPSRPWNAFSIDLTNEDGSPNQSYQGNWRDIFQNWEALSLAYPDYTTSMVFRFVNASTADGYNPYRVTKEGFEWEAPDPEDPWANIGYWGDHQIVYLLKLLEWVRGYAPEKLDKWLNHSCCAYANVPYRIRSYDDIKRDPRDTIDYDFELAREIEARVDEIGADGKLLKDSLGNTLEIALGEKLLLPALIKMTNFVPEGGIWLNTQRPEWNDANNALVGNGLSMVTVYHLRRYFRFLSDWFSELPLSDTIPVSREIVLLLKRMLHILHEHELALGKRLTDVQRRQIVDSLSNIGSAYRKSLYNIGLSGAKEDLPLTAFVEFFEQCLHFIDHTIRANRREDGLYHAYNLLTLKPNVAEIGHLDEMLEGQVAVLSSAALPPEEALEVLDALRNSSMYREDQQSYMLYPDRELRRFTEKNLIDPQLAESSMLLQQLVACKDSSLVRQDVNGGLHFNGQFRNANDLNRALFKLSQQPQFADLVRDETPIINNIFEHTFQHKKFTGRSGTFFGYEGLGSIYWHMVSKLSLAAIENLIWANEDPATDPSTLEGLQRHYREIRRGIGVRKTPDVYGAFPTDPYSHTPRHAGVQQPGMTGQVKEDILSRTLELGLRIQDGKLQFDPKFFESEELLPQAAQFDFFDIDGRQISLDLPAQSFGFTLCQVPIIYRKADQPKIVIHVRDGEVTSRDELMLSTQETAEIYARSGVITKIEVFIVPRN